ncbi:HigA family addiction module antidote protein [Leptolyngbya cf. ectocarpi LEGE 11479]|uniref:HigA family addiction module antidote protein n=1 Tax=Leptolyngbya cf. ectocarpi LEGE 11479 TaxID=1828722 RepID=A0A928X2Y3_LEPEC|nr:HigA family addiction module antitoxin [Leptolyngbya ectocarpi]MBE9066376.1 HigA family addiction module antidote protein [Leptolyngbya cf. ectocarpi LEGE 11479]
MTETRFNHLPLCERPMPAAEIIKDMHMDDMSGAQLAEAIGVSASTISRMLSGKSALTPELAIKIAAHTGGSPVVWMRIETEYRLAIAQLETDVSGIKPRELIEA